MIMTIAISILVTKINTGVNMHKFIIGNPIFFLISSISGSLFIIAISCFISSNIYIEKIGRNSLGIMCLHYKTLPLWSIVVAVTVCLKGWIGLIAQVILLTVLSFAGTEIINKIMPILLGRSNKQEMNNGKPVSHTTA